MRMLLALLGALATLGTQGVPKQEVVYDPTKHYAVFVLHPFAFPDAEVHFSYTPGGAVVVREEVDTFLAQFSDQPTIVFLCTFPYGVPEDFSIDRAADRERYCTRHGPASSS